MNPTSSPLKDEVEPIFQPPPTPPPLLSRAELHLLLRQGWLPLVLPSHLSQLSSTLFTQLTTYFSLPDSHKTALYPPSRGTESGHYHVAHEKQFLTLRHAHHASSQLEIAAAAFWDGAAALLHRILCDLAVADGRGMEVWDRLVECTMELPGDEERASGTLLRMFRYEPGTGVAEAHTDLGLLTLCVGTGPGLECLDMEASLAREREAGVPHGLGEAVWRDAGPDRAVVLVGQTLRGLSDVEDVSEITPAFRSAPVQRTPC
jgi:hypothetical protein